MIFLVWSFPIFFQASPYRYIRMHENIFFSPRKILKIFFTRGPSEIPAIGVRGVTATELSSSLWEFSRKFTSMRIAAVPTSWRHTFTSQSLEILDPVAGECSSTITQTLAVTPIIFPLRQGGNYMLFSEQAIFKSFLICVVWFFSAIVIAIT